MRIVVHYDNPDEEKLAERIVPDIEALANFAAAALSTRTGILDVYKQRSDQGYTMADIEAMRWPDNPVLSRGEHIIPGGNTLWNGPIGRDPLTDQSGWASAGGRLTSTAELMASINEDVQKMAAQTATPPAQFVDAAYMPVISDPKAPLKVTDV